MNTFLPHDEAAFFGLWSQIKDVKVLARFTVDGEPASKARARFTRSGRAYTPEKTRQAEESVAWAFKASGGRKQEDPKAAFGVFCLFFNATRQRRDVDNMVKLVLDGLNGVAWIDDAQVLEVGARKDYVTDRADARTEVVVYEVPRPAAPERECEECGKTFRTYPSMPDKAHCSNDCMLAKRRRARRRTCEQCGTEWDPGKPSKARFCSRSCFAASGRRDVQCDGCGKQFNRQAAYVREKNYCSPACSASRKRALGRVGGTCSDCGAATSKKQYARCRQCSYRATTRWEKSWPGDKEASA